MRFVARRVLVVVLTVSLVVPWSAAADARSVVARPRAFWRLPRARWRGAAEARAVQQLLAQARANLENDEPAAAEKQYSAVLRLEPANVAALIGRGTALRMLDRLDAALICFQTAIRLDPKNPETLSGRGRVLSDQKDSERALADCDEAIRLNPQSTEAYRHRGCVYSDYHQPEKAIADFNRAIELSPQNAWAFYGRARVRWDMKQPDQAIADASEAIKLAPRVSMFLRARASLWANKNETAKGIADLDQAIRLKPTEVENYLARADAYSYVNDSVRAIADANRAIELDAQSATARFFRGRSYCMKDDFDRAIADLTDAIRLDPKCTGAYYYRCIEFAAHHDFEKALANANDAIRLEPSVAELYRVRGSILETTGDKSRAKRDFDRCRDVALQELLRGLDLAPEKKHEPTIDSLLEVRIRRQVESLGYGESVQRSTVALVRSWNLPALKHQLDAAMSDWKRHKLSTPQLVEVQRKVAKNLARMINAVILPADYKTSGHELTEVVQDKVGCCQGMSLLYYVLGNAVGLSVDGLDVDVMAEGASPDGDTHTACVVKLADDSMIMVDATKQVGHHGFASEPFRLEDAFRLVGTYWELKNKSNPLGLHQVIQIINADGLVGLLEVNRAHDLAKKGDLSAAKHLCLEAFSRNGRSSGAHLRQASLYAESSQYGEAIGSASDAIARDPSLSIAYANRGWCYDKLGKADLALADFNKALSLNRRLTLALTCRCECNITSGKLELALADANAAVESNPNDAEAYRVRAEIWAGKASQESETLGLARTQLLQQFAEASDDPAKSQGTGEKTNGVDPKPNSLKENGDLTAPKLYGTPSVSDGKPVAVDEVQHASAMKEDYKHAVADLDQVLRLDPKATWALIARGYVYAFLGDFDKAIADCSEAIRLDPKNIKLYDTRRAIYEMKGDLDKAIADLDTIIRLDPKSADAYKARADLYASKHEINKAAADYAEAERLKPSDDRYR